MDGWDGYYLIVECRVGTLTRAPRPCATFRPTVKPWKGVKRTITVTDAAWRRVASRYFSSTILRVRDSPFDSIL